MGEDKTLDWSIRIDGPYGSSSQDILETRHAILVGAGHGISRIAPILQDIMIRLQDGSGTGSLEKIDLYWLIEDKTYFEWFTKMLKDIEKDGSKQIFNYHIFFLERSPDEISRRMMYISTDVVENETSISLVDNLWSRSKFGIPDWGQELELLNSGDGQTDRKVFYSGPRRFSRTLKKECKKRDIEFNRGSF